jgi:cell shape-determining protein MreC
VGRIESVGRWTSLVRVVTDAGYRGRAQILRTTSDGSSYGPECILEGTGADLCRLRYLDRTESVEVGEEVFTGGRSASMPYPMYYGTIVRAELGPSDREWTVWVKPAVDPAMLQTVQILTQTANSIRILGH